LAFTIAESKNRLVELWGGVFFTAEYQIEAMWGRIYRIKATHPFETLIGWSANDSGCQLSSGHG
jgi:hypothetical protein